MYSTPSGTLQGSADSGTVDLTKDLNFNSYSTFFGKLDWKFTHKNHLYVFGSRLTSSQQTVLTRTITFQGKTFEAGLTTEQLGLTGVRLRLSVRYHPAKAWTSRTRGPIQTCLIPQLPSVRPRRSRAMVCIMLRCRPPRRCWFQFPSPDQSSVST